MSLLLAGVKGSSRSNLQFLLFPSPSLHLEVQLVQSPDANGLSREEQQFSRCTVMASDMDI